MDLHFLWITFRFPCQRFHAFDEVAYAMSATVPNRSGGQHGQGIEMIQEFA